VSKVSRLLYPCPEPGLAGLGTHLVSRSDYIESQNARAILTMPLFCTLTQTIDLAGNIKFGPDVEHIARMGSSEQDRPGAIETEEEAMIEDEDWWVKHLQPSANRKDEMVVAIHDYVSGSSAAAFGLNTASSSDVL
jgi:2-hydroxyglutarate dehydrogenase